ncbi:hypothetical protein Glove_120g138 [Diversispora epigaea]|uniref:Uncharacterized protein n=1 Tax=Diversispora epigaea TaxID=1348612 RepID=A0A397J3W7_9GLOM|nr:hypothetical protein Glove_120g138 [Diversispora epigaea]
MFFEKIFGKKISETAKESEKNNIQNEDDDFLDPFLLIIEWNENNLQLRGILKSTITNQIEGFLGVTPFRSYDSDHNGNLNLRIRSNSIFLISDAHIIQKHQIAVNIIGHLNRTYFQGANVTLGTVYLVRATRKDVFEISEYNVM